MICVKNNKRGFTLIELLVVIAIIALLSTIAVLALGASRASARDAKRIADLKTMQTAVELYGSNHAGEYPKDIDNWAELTTELSTYVQQALLPTDPQPDKANKYVYTYCVIDNKTPASAHNKYVLMDRMEVDDAVIAGDLDSTGAQLIGTYDTATDCQSEAGGFTQSELSAYDCVDDVAGNEVMYCLGAI